MNGPQVLLAGYNGDIKAAGTPGFNPETLSAAYARISRSSDPIPLLRKKAREAVERSRKSNRAIVFGLGHHSVAEHAVLNFDILGVSRLAIEALEWHRLCSYTEKSQRYITLDGDYVLPDEFKGEGRKAFKSVVWSQIKGYDKLFPALLERLKELHPDQKPKDLEGGAKEDARYVLALATEGQLGFTASARNLELVVRRMRNHPLQEVRVLGDRLYQCAHEVVPSLVVMADDAAFKESTGHTLQDDFFQHGMNDLQEAVRGIEVTEAHPLPARGDVRMIRLPTNSDTFVLGALLFAAGNGSASACIETIAKMSEERRRELFCRSLAHLSAFDALPRAFEEASFSFEVVIDASAFAQLKRHRMATQQWGPYDLSLGFTTPQSVKDIGEEGFYNDMMTETAETYVRLKDDLKGGPVEAADYILTNAHRRRVTITMNLREVYHFSRMREDGHAQWAIRKIANDISDVVREVAPITGSLLCGKDTFDEVFARVMSGNLDE